MMRVFYASHYGQSGNQSWAKNQMNYFAVPMTRKAINGLTSALDSFGYKAKRNADNKILFRASRNDTLYVIFLLQFNNDN